jgi:hypothetical protein
MADTPKTPMTRAEYEAQIMQHSLEALKRSYRLLEETDALLASRHPQANEQSSGREADRESERSSE